MRTSTDTTRARSSPRVRAWRLVVPAMLGFVLLSVAMFVVILPTVRTRLLAEKRSALRALTSSACTSLEEFRREAEAGRLSPERARAEAAGLLRAMRYGPDGKDYFWVTDLAPRMVMHPYRPELDGQDLSTYEDPDGKRLFVEMVRVVGERGEGFVDYRWQWKDDPELIVPKLSHVRLFEPWGWVVGTGMYVDDVQAEIGRLTRRLVFASVGALAVLGLLAWFLVREGIRSSRERERTERALVAADARYRILVEHANDGIGLFARRRPTDADPGSPSGPPNADSGAEPDAQSGAEPAPWLVYANGALLALLGYAETDLPLPAERILPDTPLGRPMVVRNYERRTAGELVPRRYEAQFLRSDGTIVDVELSVARLPEGDGTSVIALFEDITERKRADQERERRDERLRESRRLEAIGRLAGGVAHDFNNLLTAIRGYADLLQLGETLGESERQAVDVILSASERAADLTAQLLAFAPRSPHRLGSLDLHDVVRSVTRLLERSIEKRVELETELRADCALVLGDRSQLENALLNVALNARDAMPDGGVIRIATDRVDVAEDDAVDAPELPPGPYVRLTVTDQGVGMDPETLAHVFEPFFTTKDVGKGTGLGLASTYGCIREHDGDITVSSRPGEGTTFTIYLPLEHPREAQEAAAEELPSPPPAAAHGECVLAVDDEAAVLQLLVRTLTALGYRVETARSGEAALAWLDDHPGEPDLVVLDLVMPGMSGQETLAAIRERHPGVPTIVTSGWSVGWSEDDLLAAGALEFLPKPFRVADLARATARHVRRRSA